MTKWQLRGIVALSLHPTPREVRSMFENLKRRAVDLWERVLRFLYEHGVIG